MFLHAVSCVLAAVITAGPSEFTSPPPKQNRGQPWLRVTTDSSRLTLRAWRIDELGLGELRSPKSDPPAPKQLAWRSIARIDELASRAHAGKIAGFVLGGAIGGGLGSAIGESIRSGPSYTDSYGVHYATGHGRAGMLLGLAALGGLGAWQGGRFGEHMVKERPWYLGTPAAVSALVAVQAESASSSRAATPPVITDTQAASARRPAVQDTTPTSSDLSASTQVVRACARIGRDDLIRMRGDFGQFQGFASVVGPRGMEGLRADPGRRRRFLDAAPAGLVTWDRIDYVQKRESSWGRGALTGGLSLFVLGGLASAAIVAGFGGGGAEPLGAALYGGTITGSIGAVLGGLIGGAVPAWYNVYDGP